MQGKGIVRFFLILMAVVCAIQYLMMLPTRKVEKAADNYASAVASDITSEDERLTAYGMARTAFLDSMSTESIVKIPLIKEFTYDELKSRQLALGLDLKGGMSVVLQVEIDELLKTSLSNNSKDATFLMAVENAKERQRSSQSDFLSIFYDEYKKIAPENKNLASIFARNSSLREQINASSSDDEVIRVLRSETSGIVERTFELLKERIDKLGVVQPNVSLDAARDLILVELPGIDNPERARSFLESAAKLEFWNVYRITDQQIFNAFLQADERLKSLETGDTLGTETTVQYDTIFALDSNGTMIPDSIASIEPRDESSDPLANQGPLFKIFNLNVNTGQGFTDFFASMGTADRNQKDQVMEYLQRPDIARLFPSDISFKWERKPVEDVQTGKLTNRYRLFAIKQDPGSDAAPLEGDRVTRASSDFNPTSGQNEVILRFDNRGSKKWAEMTTKAYQDNEREVAIVLDNEVVSAPGVRGPITGGNTSITGGFTVQEGEDLANILQIGKLPATTNIIQEATVGPSLGEENINRSLRSLLIGFGLLLVFMIFYYGGAGILSIIALFANLFFIFGALASYGTVLTLPGIAGIVLTIGMAVDANVIIFERIKEELREGKSLRNSIIDGYKHSYSAIIDANVTTLLVAFVLAYFGLGPIKGFAVVLIIGVIFSFATAVFLTRLIIDWWLSKDRTVSFWTSATEHAFANLKIDWLGKRRIGYIISSAIILIGVASFFVRKFDLGVDFKGGYSYTVQIDPSIDVEMNALRASLTESLGGSEPVVKTVDTRNTFNIVTDYLIDSEDDDAQDRVVEQIFAGVNSVAGGNLDMEHFKRQDVSGTHILQGSKVSPTIADDIKGDSVYATIFALLLIFLYIFIRFSKWQYSLGAVAALFHDTLIVLGIFSLLHGILPFTMEIDQPFIAALLTVIGYSINDTVVVFDRIREYLNTYTRKSKTEVINHAINSTVSRTVITSLTTLFVVGTLFLFGGASIRGFAFAVLIGIIVGTYSSIFVATPILHDLTGDFKRKETQKKRFSKAVQA